MDGKKVLNSILFRVKKAHFQMQQMPLQQKVIIENPFLKLQAAKSHSFLTPVHGQELKSSCPL